MKRRQGRMIAVTGGRAYPHIDHVFGTLDMLDEREHIEVIVHGGAGRRDPKTKKLVGADLLAGVWGRSRQRTVITCYAEWDRLDLPAGPDRNEYMLWRWEPALLVAFPGDRGTAHCIRVAGELGIPVEKV